MPEGVIVFIVFIFRLFINGHKIYSYLESGLSYIIDCIGYRYRISFFNHVTFCMPNKCISWYHISC